MGKGNTNSAAGRSQLKTKAHKKTSFAYKQQVQTLLSLSPADIEDANLQDTIGASFFFGKQGLEKDYTKAVEWFEAAAQKGHARAAMDLAICYDEGYGVEVDIAKAIEWYKKAGTKGIVEAYARLGFIYLSGHHIEQDIPKGIEYYEEAAKAENLEALRVLAGIYAQSEHMETPVNDPAYRDEQKALNYLERAGKKNPQALSVLATLYFAGDFSACPQDTVKAVDYYTQAAEAGDFASQLFLGNLYYLGDKDFPQDFVKALKWYKESFKRQHLFPIELQINTILINGGKGIPQKFGKAFSWFSQLTRDPDPKKAGYAYCILGKIYLEGTGNTPINREKGMAYLQKAVESDNGDAHFRLAEIYEQGLYDIPASSTKALEHYQEALKQEHPFAQERIDALQRHKEELEQKLSAALS